jgi:hypothetical protein
VLGCRRDPAEDPAMGEADWRAANRANWDERVAVHLAPGSS